MGSTKNHSPLRYPGGKACLSGFISNIAQQNGLVGGTYCELYAGGAGAALNLLFDNTFNQIHINDADYSIYAFWFSILNHTDLFIQRLRDVTVDINEWHRQKNIYLQGRNVNIIDLGFSTFFLNRTNRSGIIHKAGPIGGQEQNGNYLIDVRFNKEELIRRIEKIAAARDQITLTNEDAVRIIRNINEFHPQVNDLFIYLDPPYYNKGKLLYLNNYDHFNHQTLAAAVENLIDVRWLISYDNVPQIIEMYRGYRMSSFNLNYTLQSKKFGSELLVFSPDLIIGNEIKVNSRNSELVLF
ncbi:DNA adenine methylase [Mucilaginibacter litoreus]|uniref:DNA adenine methylase n=1 Tax=Mucilaginibacter litoreus TaxID=1048221 RepID=A0ABW3AYK9_9SPHI